MLEIKNIYKTYRSKKGEPVHALKDVSVSLADRGMVFILGKSGSGKSTLLNAIGGLDKFDSGEIIIKGKSSKDFSQADFDSYRNTFIGFVFQEYNLLSEFSIGKNIAIALELQGKKADKQAIKDLLAKVDLDKDMNRKVTELSGGQKQRIAIARALIKDPEIIIADEPTGALDSNTGRQVLESLKALSKEKLVIIVSHDREYAEMYADRIIEMKDGKILSDKTKQKVAPNAVSEGMSIIDDAVIHIKKGYTLTTADLNKINSVLKNGDAERMICIGPEKTNDAKRAMNIDDSGNTERFDSTQESDVQLKSYDGKKLKLIKSKLRFKDSFKIGASAVKTKPIRLLFTIFLALIAFTLFGLTLAMTNFNNASIVHDLIVEENNVKGVVISSSKGYSNGVFTSKDIDRLKENYSGHIIIPVAFGGDYSYSRIEGINPGTDKTITSYTMGILPKLTDEQFSALGMTSDLLAGYWPVGTLNEIVVSKNVFDSLKKGNTLNLTLENYEDLIGEEISIQSNNGSSMRFKVAGIIDTKVDANNLKAYSSSTTTSTGTGESTQLTQEEQRKVESLANYYGGSSLLNACFVSNMLFDSKFGAGDAEFNNYNMFKAGTDDNSWGFSDLSPYSDVTNTSGIKFRNGVSGLANNQIVVEEYKLKSLLGLDNSSTLSTEQLLDAFNSIDKLEVNIRTWDADKDDYKWKLEIVGFFSNSYDLGIEDSWGPVVSDYFYAEYAKECVGFSRVLSNLTGDRDADMKFIESIEGYKNGDVTYAIRNQYSDLLGMIKDLISTFTEIIIYVALGFAVFAGLMLTNYISISVMDKRREIGILRAIGARGKDVFRIFFNEGLIICSIVAVLSCISTFGFAILINNLVASGMGITINFVMVGIKEILALVGVSLLVSIISTFFPVLSIAKKQPIDSINNK